MRLRWIILLTAVTMLVTAVWIAPAATLYAWLAPPGAIELRGIDGRIARGQAQALLHDGQLRATGLRWRLRPWRLLVGEAAWQVEFGGIASGQVEAAVTATGRIRLRDLRLASDAAALLDAAGYRGLPLRGALGVELTRVDFDRDGWPQRVDGEARLLDLAWTLGNQTTAFGDFSARLSVNEHRQLVAELQANEAAALDLRGDARLGMDRGYEAELRLRARPQAAPQVANLLRLLGQPNAQGEHRVQQRGRLR